MNESITLYQCEVRELPTNVLLHIPAGHYGRVAALDGLARAGVVLLSQVIEAHNPREVTIAATAPADPVRINHGDRIAQVIVEKCLITPLGAKRSLGCDPTSSSISEPIWYRLGWG